MIPVPELAEELRGADPATLLVALTSGARPVVLRGLVRHWPLVDVARTTETLRSYLVSRASREMAEIFQSDADVAGNYAYGPDLAGFNFERVPATLATALDTILARVTDPSLGSAYLGSLPIPAFLPGLDLPHPLPDSRSQPRIWIGTASRAACHYDAVDNLACAVAGRRRFTLYPPQSIGDLYVGPIDHTIAGQPISLATADTARHPRFPAARARAMTAELEPGDALYLPKLWWHGVEATAPFNLMVNYWWDANATGPDAPMLSMLMAMIAIAERPAEEREAFRAFFDHYVFRPEGHPLAHLPTDQRGILGQIDRAAYGRIRATIMRELRGD